MSLADQDHPARRGRQRLQAGKGRRCARSPEACKAAGLEFGVYLSPWDRNHPDYGKPGYIQVYRAQLAGARSGPVFRGVWMDGANGGTGYYRGRVGPEEFKGPLENRQIDRKTYYDWPATWALIRRLQPDAMMFSDVGPDLRWCGNESGYALDPCWQTYTPRSRDNQGEAMIGFTAYQEAEHGHRDGKFWMPSEVDVSIRPGWFWHEAENTRVRSPENLMQIYLQSVGRGATFNLNVPPDRRGLLHENDVESLRQLGAHLRATFSANLAAGAVAAAGNVRGGEESYSADRLLDADPWSAWVTDDGVRTPEVVIELAGEKTFNLVRLREDIRLGQRIESMAVDAWVDGAWKELAAGRSIGACRLWRTPKTTTTKVRLRVTESPVCPALSDFGLFLEPAFGPWLPPVGTDPKLLAAAKAKAGWKVVSASYEAEGNAASRAVDGNPATIWHTHVPGAERGFPQEFAVDLGGEQALKGFTYLPRQDGTVHGMVDQYAFAVSADGAAWQIVAEGEFGNLRAHPVEQVVPFAPVRARYIKFIARHALEM
ncbi:MAG: discoidin domain-containing protein, partial [Kiritimatiellia bacterium]